MASTISRQSVVLDPDSTVSRILLVAAGCSSPFGPTLPPATGQIRPSEAEWLNRFGRHGRPNTPGRHSGCHGMPGSFRGRFRFL